MTDRPGDMTVDGQHQPTDSPVERETPGLLSILHRSVVRGEAFLDVGANVGVFSVDMALHLGPQGRVYAFEPAADAIKHLEDNAKRAGASDRIEIFQIALGSARDHRALHAHPQHPHDWTKRSLFLDGPVVGVVRIRALDDLVRTGEISFRRGLAAVKIDVEGAEADVIRGASNTLRDLRPRIMIVETIPNHQDRARSSVDEIGALLADVGYASSPPGSLSTRFVYNTIYRLRERSTGSREA
jgi:FkbM family methyltransferase